MPNKPPASCKVCHKHESEVGRISWRGKCAACGDAINLENIYGLRLHSGEPLLRWRRGMARGVGGVLIDDLADDET
jgi:hypothetical protein